MEREYAFTCCRMLIWMSRCLERAEHSARLIDVERAKIPIQIDIEGRRLHVVLPPSIVISLGPDAVINAGKMV
jgi:hypothetical protein